MPPKNSPYLPNSMPQDFAFQSKANIFVIIYLDRSWQKERFKWKKKKLLLVQQTYACFWIWNTKKDRVNLTKQFHLHRNYACVLLTRSLDCIFIFNCIFMHTWFYHFSSYLLASMCVCISVCVHIHFILQKSHTNN